MDLQLTLQISWVYSCSWFCSKVVLVATLISNCNATNPKWNSIKPGKKFNTSLDIHNLPKIRGVARVCGAPARNKMAPPYFLLTQGWLLENLSGEKWQATVWPIMNIIGFIFIRPIKNFIALDMQNGCSYIFYTCHDFAPPRGGARGKCPPLPPLATPLPKI